MPPHPPLAVSVVALYPASVYNASKPVAVREQECAAQLRDATGFAAVCTLVPSAERQQRTRRLVRQGARLLSDEDMMEAMRPGLCC